MDSFYNGFRFMRPLFIRGNSLYNHLLPFGSVGVVVRKYDVGVTFGYLFKGVCHLELVLHALGPIGFHGSFDLSVDRVYLTIEIVLLYLC